MTTASPPEIPPTEASAFSRQQWRTRFLRGILGISLIVGALFLLAAWLTPTEMVLRIIYTAAFGVLLLITILPLPASVKGSLFLAILFTLGVSGMLENGLRGDTRVWFIAFVVLTTMLLGTQAGIWANAVSALIMSLFGWLILAGRVTIINASIDVGSVDTWVVAILENIGISALISAGITRLERDFSHAQETASTALEALRQERSHLEELVRERTATLERKASQLEAASIVARAAASQSNLDTLLDQTAKLITERFGYYHTGIFLLDETGEYAVLHAASSEGGKQMLEHGHRLAVGRQGIVGTAAFTRQPHLAQDTGKDLVFFNNPYLPLTRAEVAIPLKVGETVIGVLDIQSTEPVAFSQENVDVLQTLADQIALAIQNTRLLSESQATLARLEAITTESTVRTWQERLATARLAYRYTPKGVVLAEPSGKKSEERTAGLLKVPIILRGQQIGTITIHRKNETEWPEEDQTLATEIATQVGLALENARLLEDARRRAAQEQTIGELTTRLSRTLDPDALLQAAVRELYKLPHVDEVSVFITPPQPSAGTDKG